ncbi:MAG: ATP-binding cassette domain-containing protein [Candidatus Ancillula sp.]|jgi:sulfonate transport system ATP-binding protein|nr:ATP-binding cassette domain-containing protein [Candidatus Ancillula sp.]
MAKLLDCISKEYDGVKILDNFSMHLDQREFVTIVGRSGVGKSTLLRMLARLESPTSGEVLDEYKKCAIMFQEPKLIPWLKTWQNVTLGLVGTRKQLYQVAKSMLNAVGLCEFEERYILSLSGGQASRVALARALVRKPDLLLLDEPFAALDALTRLEMQNLVLDLQRQLNFSTVMVTHDVNEAVYLSNRIIVLVRDSNTGQVENRELLVDKNKDEAEYANTILRWLGLCE